MMECPSCMAAKVAVIARIAMGMMCQPIVGTAMKSRNPVNLLAIV
jgi:hypothetical protein